MKFLSFLISLAPMVAAFAPPSMQRVASTGMHMIDPELIHYLAQNVDATSVEFVNCDNMNCELMLGTKVGDNWQFESMGPADPAVWDQKTRIVKMAMDWTE